MVATPFSYYESDDCGYCLLKKIPKPLASKEVPQNAACPSKPVHISIGAQIITMTVETYEKCMNLGFRRSGVFLYKTDMLRNCCRMYTIRTNMLQMKISKEHRQVVNRFKRAIADTPQDETLAKTFDLRSLIDAEQKSSRFTTTYDSPHFTVEKYELYKKYQTIVHKDPPEEVSENGFRLFLIQTPFTRDAILGDEEEWALLDTWVKDWRPDSPLAKCTRKGPVHECYYLDGKLIALSILDFLPGSLSSVYFIYDPDYAHLSLGTLLSLREILMCNELGIPYYYLGYYIDDCKKMRYKAKFGGEILDVCNNVFVPFEKVDSLLKGDQLWTLGNIGSETNASDKLASLLSSEPQLDLDVDPKVYQGQVSNSAESIYGNEATYSDAKEELMTIYNNYDVSDMEVPLVLPGAITIRQIKEKLLDPETNLLGWFFDGDNQEVNTEFAKMDSMKRQFLLDCIRLLGYDICQSLLILSF